MADGRLFKNDFIAISAKDHPISMKFGMQLQIFVPRMKKNKNSANSKWWTAAT